MQLNTTNPNCFVYKIDELLIELLGGIRIEGLDRMRVTMKVTVINRKHADHLNNPELAGLSIRHNLDLYNDTQVEKFVRRVAEKLETGSIALTKAIEDIYAVVGVQTKVAIDFYSLHQQHEARTSSIFAGNARNNY